MDVASARTACGSGRDPLVIPTGCLVLGTLIVFAVSGCRGNVEVLEAQLRNQEDALTAAHEQLADRETELAQLRRDSLAMERQIAELSQGKVVAEQVVLPARAVGVRIDRRLSGLLPQDEDASSVVANLVFAPVDREGETVKMPGRFQVRVRPLDGLQQVSAAELDVDAEGSWQYWRAGVLGTGFQLQIPCGPNSSATRWKLELQFEASDGRSFRDEFEFGSEPAQETGGNASS